MLYDIKIVYGNTIKIKHVKKLRKKLYILKEIENIEVVEMADIKELIKTIEKYNKKYTVAEKSNEADKLIAKMHEKKSTSKEYFEVEEKVKAFLKSDASEVDKQKVLGYTESLSMICSAIREGRLNI